MTKTEKNYYLNKACCAYYSGFGGIEIKDIIYGIDDKVVFVANAWAGKKSVHSRVIRCNAAGNIYFSFANTRIMLDECIRA